MPSRRISASGSSLVEGLFANQASRLAGLEIDYDQRSGAALSDKGVACLCVQAHVIQIGTFRRDIFVQGYRLHDFVCRQVDLYELG